MTTLRAVFALLLVGALIAAAFMLVPRGIEAGRLLAAQDDPVALADLSLADLDVAKVAREIEAALAAGDAELAESFVLLARERGIAVEPALADKVAQATREAASASRHAKDFVRGLITGEPDDLASLAGTTLGDLFVFGDIRDALREGSRLARGEEADELILALAGVGLAVTAGTYASGGVATPARVGLSVVKAARKTGRVSARFAGAVGRSMREAVDVDALRRALGASASLQPALAVRAAREVVKVEKAGGLMQLVANFGKIQSKAGPRAAMDAIRLAEEPKDVARLARLAEAKGSKTRAILKFLGRAAIAVPAALFDLALWVFWAAMNLVMLCVAVKRATERITLAVIRRGKARRVRRREAALLARELRLARREADLEQGLALRPAAA